ncbi:hypothetical protein PybrP1_006514 [[Pythium] brassicae (nom. inval.)]|nr:hypothetical protein PybrP1_006514 [[Pythium] brassicae (nom. inval.)]
MKRETTEAAFKVDVHGGQDAGVQGGQKHLKKQQYQQQRGRRRTAAFTGRCFECGERGHKRSERSKKKQGGAGDQFVFAVAAAASKSSSWLLDSGASSHMTHDRNDFVRYKALDSRVDVFVADGGRLPVHGVGDVELQLQCGRTAVATDVLHVPALNRKLLSVPALTAKGAEVEFKGAGCEIKMSGVCVAQGRRENKLYRIEFGGQEHAMAVQAAGSTVKTTRPLELVHTDVVGPMETKSKGGARYGLVLVDEWSRFVVIYLLKTKSQVLQSVKAYKSEMEATTGERLRCLRSDNGSEYISKAFATFYSSSGIKHQTSAPYSPQQNGLAECANRSLVEMARSMLQYQHMSKEWWGEALKTAAYTVNRLTNTARKDTTPYELLCKRRPNVAHMRVFGARGFVHVDNAKRSKWDAKAHRCVFLGYAEGSKAYCVWDANDDRVVVSRSVVLDERAPPAYIDTRQPSSFLQHSGIDVHEDDVHDRMPQHPRAPTPTRDAMDVDDQPDEDMEAVDNNGVILEEDVLMEPPAGANVEGDRVCKLQRSIYALKQSGAVWHKTIASALAEMKFESCKSCKSDTCVFVRRTQPPVFLALYVDDIIVCASTDETASEIKAQLGSRFAVKDLGHARVVLGVQVQYDQAAGKLLLNQPQYIERLIARCGLEAAHTVMCPAVAGQESDVNSPPTDERRFRALVGALQYIAHCTRPDIASSVGMIAQHAEQPRQAHLAAALRIVKFLKGTTHDGIVYARDKGSQPIAYSDASWPSDVSTRRSTTGLFISMCGAPVVYRSKRQATVALSTAEAEYIALAACAQDVLWLRALLGELGIAVPNPTTIRIDNTAAISMAQHHGYQSRAKHIDLRHHFVRETIKNGHIKLEHVATENQLADFLTKPLAAPRLRALRERAGIGRVHGAGRAD